MPVKPILVMAAALAMSTAAVAQQGVQPDATLPVPNPGAAAPATAPVAPAAPAATAATGMPVNQPPITTGEFIIEQQSNHTLASDLMGQKVVDSSGQQVATISDLILDESSSIAGVILATGGFLGIGEHNVGVELEDLTPTPNADGYVIDLTRDAIEAAPAFKTLASATAERDAEMLRQQSATPTPATPAPAVPPAAPAQ